MSPSSRTVRAAVVVGPKARVCGMSTVSGCNPRRKKSKALLRTTPSTTIGVRKRTPPRIIVPTKRETAFMNLSAWAALDGPNIREASDCFGD